MSKSNDKVRRIQKRNQGRHNPVSRRHISNEGLDTFDLTSYTLPVWLQLYKLLTDDGSCTGVKLSQG